MSELLILILVLIAAFAGTLTGFGTSTILVPILSLVYPLTETLLFVGIIHWFGDIWKMVFFKKGIDWKLILLFGIPGVLVAYLASQLPLNISGELLKKLLGIFLISYVIFLFLKSRWKIRRSDFNAVLGGGLSGFFAGLFGVGGAIRGAFLSVFSLKKAVYIFTSGAIGFLIDSSRITGYIRGGINLDRFDVEILLVSILISLLGAYAAKQAVTKVPQSKFRIIVALGLLMVGTYYVL